MANVQIENGYTRIANDILDNMAKIKLSPTQYRLLFVIWRYTYGFQRIEHDLSLSFLSEATGCDKRSIQRDLKDLEIKNIINQKIKNGSYRKISFNKDYELWCKTIGETANGETTIGEITNGEIANASVGETTNGTIGETANQERKYLNKNIKKKEEEEHLMNRILDLLQKSKILEEKDITEFLREDINDVINTFGFEQPEEMILEAIKDAARGNGRTWKYVYKKLVDWKKKGIKIVADLENPSDGGINNGAQVHQYRRGTSRPSGESNEPVTGGQIGRLGKRKTI